MKLIINKIFEFWIKKKFLEIKKSNENIGAATYNYKNCFLLIKKKKLLYFFLQECKRQFDSYINFCKKKCIHNQIQVIIKPIPINFLSIYTNSLFFLKKRISFKKDNWNSPILGAKGVGFESTVENIEISQLTIFYKFGNKFLKKPILEITYGVERISNIFKKNKYIKEKFFSINYFYKKYSLKNIIFFLKKTFFLFKKKNYFLSYNYLLKVSNFFNIIDNFYLFNNFNRIKIIFIIKKMSEKIIEKI